MHTYFAGCLNVGDILGHAPDLSAADLVTELVRDDVIVDDDSLDLLVGVLVDGDVFDERCRHFDRAVVVGQGDSFSARRQSRSPATATAAALGTENTMDIPSSEAEISVLSLLKMVSKALLFSPI